MSDFVMPSLGADMEAGTLVEWRIAPGDRVHKGQVVAVVETDKGAIDVEVFDDGIVEELCVAPGTTVPVGTLLARLGVEGKPTPGTAPVAEAKPAPEAEPRPDTDAGPAPDPKGDRKLQAPGPPDHDHAPPASPAARRRARESGLDIADVRGSRPDGAIVLDDVEAALAAMKTGPATRRPPANFDAAEMRRAIAAAMSRSKREIPHYYLGTTVDLAAAEAWIDDYNHGRSPAERILMSALFMKACALALARHPALNGHFVDDGFVPADAVNLGMAIHLRGGGLVAPAILAADTLSLPELMLRLQDLVKRARGGGLRGSEVGSATVTVTSLGERGVDTVWGVIHPPQVAMVGFGRPRRQPLAIGDALAARPAVHLTLAADHRVCDGHLGALFLGEIEEQLQQPEQL